MKPPANGAFIMGQNSMNAVLGSLVIKALLRALSIRLTGTTIVESAVKRLAHMTSLIVSWMS